MDEMIGSVIKRAVNDAERYPFLFIGSGLSLRYTGSPNWVGLLRTVCEKVFCDEFAYTRYDAQARADKANGSVSSELPHVATLMEPDVNRTLLSSDTFSDFRSRHRDDLLSGASPLKTYIADLMSNFAVTENDEIRALSLAGHSKISGVITTNYDTLCETLFPDFEVYVGEGNLLFAEPNFAQEIYEIHGSMREPDTMVLTDADYAEFSARRKYLAAKLLTIFVEYPVVFLGYSIQDENIKSILSDVCECVPPEKLERLHNRLVFVQHGASTAVTDHTMDLDGRMLSMTCITTDDFMSVFEALQQSQRMYSPKVIRELRGSVFRLAEKIDPSSEVVTSGFDAVLDRMEPDQKIAIQIAMSSAGVGRPITSEEIFQDVVLDDLHQDPRFVVDAYLSSYVRRLPNVMPVFKYIQDLADDEVEKGVLAYARGLTSLDSFRNASIRKSMDSTHRRFAGDTTVRGLEKAADPGKLFYFIPQLYEDEIDVDDLGRVLRDALLATGEGSDERKSMLKNSHFRKCVRIYDFLRYAPEK
jgi:hypothetical protein